MQVSTDSRLRVGRWSWATLESKGIVIRKIGFIPRRDIQGHQSRNSLRRGARRSCFLFGTASQDQQSQDCGDFQRVSLICFRSRFLNAPFRDVVALLSDVEGYLRRIKTTIIDAGVLRVVSSTYSTHLERSADNPSRRILSQLQSNSPLCYKGLWRSPLENPRTAPGRRT